MVQKELETMVGRMVGLEYIKMEEVPGIPRRQQPLRFVAYATLSRQPGAPDVVLLRGNARQMMLLAEAAMASGLLSPLPVMGSVCAAIPAAMQSGKAATSLGCVGNRVYTGLRDGEFDLAVPGASIAALLEKAGSIVAANRELEQFHRGRCAALNPTRKGRTRGADRRPANRGVRSTFRTAGRECGSASGRRFVPVRPSRRLDRPIGDRSEGTGERLSGQAVNRAAAERGRGHRGPLLASSSTR